MHWLPLPRLILCAARCHSFLFFSLGQLIGGYGPTIVYNACITGPDDGVPCFYMWGDWCTPDEPRANATHGTGPPSSAANYILAVDAMVSMATAMNYTADAARYTAELATWRAAYHSRFWTPGTGTYTADQAEVQTISAISLGAGTATFTSTLFVGAISHVFLSSTHHHTGV